MIIMEKRLYMSFAWTWCSKYMINSGSTSKVLVFTVPATNWMASYWKRSSVWVLFSPHLTHNHPYPHYVSHIDQASYEELLSLLRQQSLAPRKACWVCKGANHWVCVCVRCACGLCGFWRTFKNVHTYIYTHIRHDIYSISIYIYVIHICLD